MSWRPQVKLIDKRTGKLFLVLHSYKGATVVVDLQNKSNPSPMQVILERDYNNWEDEHKMIAREKKPGWFDEGKLEWTLAL